MERSLLWIIVFSVKLYLEKSLHQSLRGRQGSSLPRYFTSYKGHTLVIPKEHVRNILEMSAETAETVFSRVPKIARAVQKATKAIGMSVLNNNEEVAGQTVFHAHIHLVPRYGSDDGIHMSFDEHEPDFAALANLADSIAKEVTE